MKRFIFQFRANVPKGIFESYVPADHYVEAYEILQRNAVKTTGVPMDCWVPTVVDNPAN